MSRIRSGRCIGPIWVTCECMMLLQTLIHSLMRTTISMDSVSNLQLYTRIPWKRTSNCFIRISITCTLNRQHLLRHRHPLVVKSGSQTISRKQTRKRSRPMSLCGDVERIQKSPWNRVMRRRRSMSSTCEFERSNLMLPHELTSIHLATNFRRSNVNGAKVWVPSC
jgi:hypothetical protein